MEFHNEYVDVELHDGREEKKLNEKRKKLWRVVIDGVMTPTLWGIAIILYLAISFGLGESGTAPSGASIFAYLWTILFLCPLIPGTFWAVLKRTWSIFPIWSPTLFAFLFVGLYTGMWNPYWVIVLVIPAFYLLASGLDKAVKPFRDYRNS